MALKDVTDSIKLVLNVPYLLQHYGIPMRQGNILCPLPDHNDKNTPSFSVYPGGEAFHCFGCHAAGDIFNFIQAYENCSFWDSLHIAADIANVKIPQKLLGKEHDPSYYDVISFLTNFAKRAHEEFISFKGGALCQRTMDYYKFLYMDTMKTLLVGYAPSKKWVIDVVTHEMGLSEDMLYMSGLCLKGEDGYVSHMMAGRILFPYISGYKKQVVYMAGRHVPWEKEQGGKYKKLATNNRLVSPCIRNDYLYNDYLIKPHKPIILTEGITDAISAYEHGIDAVSMATTSIKDDIVARVAKRLESCSKVYISNDTESHKAGEKGAARVSRVFIKQGVIPKVIALPAPADGEKEDLNSYLKKHSAEEYKKLVADAKEYFFIMIDRLKNLDVNSLELADKIREILPYIPEGDIYIQAAASDIASLSDVYTRGAIKGILRDEAIKAKRANTFDTIAKKEKEDGKFAICNLGRRTIARNYNGYFEVRTAADGTEVEEQITNFVIDAKEKQMVSYDVKKDGTIDAEETYFLVDIKAMGMARGRERVMYPHDISSSAKFYEACASGGVMLLTNASDVATRMIVAAEVERTAKDTYFIGAFGKVGPYFLSKNFVKYKGKEYFSNNGTFKLDDGSCVSVGHPIKKDPTTMISFHTELPFPGFVDHITRAVYDCWGHSGLLALAWTYGSTLLTELIEGVGCYPIGQLTGTKGSGKTVLCNFLAKIAGNSTVHTVSSTVAAIHRMMDTLKDIPMFIDEYRDLKDTHRRQLETMLRESYNRESLSKCDLSDQRSTINYATECCIMLSGEEIPTDSATYSRIIDINMLNLTLDKESYKKNILPHLSKVSYLYYMALKKAVPGEGELRDKVHAWETLVYSKIKNYQESAENRDGINFGILIYMYEMFIKSEMEWAPSNEEMLDYLIKILVEKKSIQKAFDPVANLIEYIKDKLTDEEFEINRWIGYDTRNNHLLIRIMPLIKEYNKGIRGSGEDSFNPASIKNQLKILRDDIVSYQSRRVFRVGGQRHRFDCMVIKADCAHAEFRELADNIIDTVGGIAE